MKSNNITVIGCGRWGSFLAWYSARLGKNVLMHGLEDSESYVLLKSTRQNEYLSLPESIEFSSDIKTSLAHSDKVIISIGAQGLFSLAREIRDALGGHGDKTYILCMKGIVEDGGLRLSEVMQSVLGKDVKCIVWVGPGHAEDFTRGIPNCMLMASEDTELAKNMCSVFASPLIRFYYSTDVIGCEIGAATKNVIGIAAGILDGINYSSLKGALMARGPREIARLTAAMGGDERTIFGLSHIGDYEATLFSNHSHNRSFGENFVKKLPYGKLAEGFYTVRSLMFLKDKYGIELPISNAVNEIIHVGRDPKEVIESMFLREIKTEF